ncbi:MAG: HD-GYP domain-containing protein [Rubrivivax sp.]
MAAPSSLKKISVAHARVGMFLHAVEGSWITNPFWKTKFVLTEQAQVRKLHASTVHEIWIDLARGLDVEEGVAEDSAAPAASPAPAARQVEPALEPPAPAAEPQPEPEPQPAPPQAASPAPTVPAEPARARAAPEAPAEAEPARNAQALETLQPRVSLASELERAAGVVRQGQELVVGLFEQARLGRALDAEQCLPVVESVTESVFRNSGALLSLTRLRKRDEYTYMHSVSVCALMVALARELRLDAETVREAGLAGLLHDIGKALMPEDILSKPSKLTNEEFSIIRTHPRRGFELLHDANGTTDRVMDVTMHHHERVDGMGYPHGLPKDKISLFARMGAVCDVYDAITTHRAYKSRWDPAESIARMYSWKGHFDQEVLNSFVRTVGIYPVGAIVRLESQRIAIVHEQNVNAYLKPVVQVFYSLKTRLPTALQRVDLAAPGCHDRIIAREASEDWSSLNFDVLWKSRLARA